MNSSVRAWRRGLATTAAVLLLGTGAVACGGDDKPAANESSAADAGSNDDGAGGANAGAADDTGDDGASGNSDGVKYAACMRENGVDVADPKPGEQPQVPEGVARSVLDKAEEKCGDAPGGQEAGSGGLADDPKLEELSLANQKCLRENGYEVPETKEGQGGAPKMPGEDPVLDRAMAACKATGDALKDYIERKMGQK
ncbi:hypothetical protein [Streptomyces cadmiisoli]|uniref:Secreted protein n=1 Tax=Streptomyces cadmiisoli TaxID=2184053 RepID=A0A2Z4JDJ2_9ACTN|nr:hypothetical protein [Streptomyces cadmiisoli]AWW43189.1 hypothetical protein DN051_42050 [Streptomyces cadmiisoli]